MANKPYKAKPGYEKTRKPGRPTTYRDSMCDAIIKAYDRDYTEKIYKEEINDDGEKIKVDTGKVRACDFPTWMDASRAIDVPVGTMERWAREKVTEVVDGKTVERYKYADFRRAYEKCKQIQKDILITNSMNGRYHAGFSIFCAKNVTDMRDEQHIKQDVDLKAKVELSKTLADRIDDITKGDK